MSDPKLPGDNDVAIDPLDKAEENSENAWKKAKEDVDDLSKLGHEDEEGEDTK